MRQSKANEIKDRAVKSARSVLCVDVLKNAGYPLRQRGNQIYSICYNCGGDEVKSDKFSVNSDKNLYYCFGCGCGGGAPKLYSEIYKVSYMDACLYLAYQAGDIDLEEYEEATQTSDGTAKIKNDEAVFKKFEEREAEREVEVKAPVKTVDLVYRHLLSLPEFQLSQRGYDYLIKRRLTGEEIREIGFFEYLTQFSVDALTRSIKEEVPTFNEDNYLGVAGFFFVYTNAEKTRGRWAFKPPYKDCVGIPLRDANGLITALQMRYIGKNPTKNKYFYVSSKYIKIDGKTVGYGAGPGSPVSVIYPESVKNSAFFIGEGFFKMKEVAKMGSVALSVQGVNSFTYVADEVKECVKSPLLRERTQKEALGKPVSYYIVYDADMYSKIQVLNAGVSTAKYLQKHFPGRKICFLTWNPNLGKGFDDMKYYCEDNGMDYRRFIKPVSADTFIRFVEEAIGVCDELIGSTEKIRQSDEYSNALYAELWGGRVSKL